MTNVDNQGGFDSDWAEASPEDDYGEESSPDSGDPWAEPEADDRDWMEEDWGEKDKGKERGELTYREGEDEHPDPSDEIDRLTRNIRKLQDAESFRAGARVNRVSWGEMAWEAWDDDPKQSRRVEAWQLKITEWMDAEKVARLPVNHPFLAIPFREETHNRIDQTEAPPLGMTPRRKFVGDLVKEEWDDQWSRRPMIADNPQPGVAYYRGELSVAKADAMRDITSLLVADQGFGEPPTRPLGELSFTYSPDGATVNKELIVGASPEATRIANEVLRDLNLGRDAHCHGYASCCRCPTCLNRSHQKPPTEVKQSDLERVKKMVRLTQGRIFGEETRGGARERKFYRKAKRIYLDGSIAGTHQPHHRYDFRGATKGLGKKGARDDAGAIEQWLLCQTHQPKKR